MNKKIILISAGSVVLIAALVIAVLVLLKPGEKEEPVVVATTPEVIKYSADGSRDYGACTFVDKTFVQSTLGEPANNLQGPDTVGLAIAANGDQIQVCSYAFVPGGTAENQFNAKNAFTLELSVHKNSTTKQASIDIQPSDAKKIDGIAESAWFINRPFSDGSSHYTVAVYKGLRQYAFNVHQPNGVKNFTAAQAQEKLTAIAKSATY